MSDVIQCRCCGKPTKTALQKLHDGGTLILITCENKAERCNLCGYTFTGDDYFERDLSAYTWREKAWSYD